MAEQWPPTFCRSNPCPTIPQGKFTIHGLWPSNQTSLQSSKCVTKDPHLQSFNKAMISTLEAQLNLSWPNLKGQSNELFWAYEWNKHGVCSSNMFNQTQYFELAQNIWSRYDIFDILKQQGISPRTNVWYPTNDIRRAITNHIGAIPQIHCVNNELLEIRMCLDQSGIKYMTCPKLGNCKNNVLWQP
ncbi:ribonuclease S-7-like [Cicer arietinum]|uniref:ribonuclease S-7-like n=1 Tax=Cicer arietinum TaxID=3827 RepID=UPI003CC54BA2